MACGTTLPGRTPEAKRGFESCARHLPAADGLLDPVAGNSPRGRSIMAELLPADEARRLEVEEARSYLALRTAVTTAKTSATEIL